MVDGKVAIPGVKMDCLRYGDADDFSNANKILHDWAWDAPKEGAYNKTDFIVVFEDGESYFGRYDLQHYTEEWADLSKNIKSNAEFYSGRRKPSHISQDEYDAFIERSKSNRRRYTDLLDNYDLSP